MIKHISYRFNMSKPEDREAFQVVDNAELLESCYREFYQELRSLYKHGQFNGVDPHDVILDVWEKFLKAFKPYNVKVAEE